MIQVDVLCVLNLVWSACLRVRSLSEAEDRLRRCENDALWKGLQVFAESKRSAREPQPGAGCMAAGNKVPFNLLRLEERGTS